MVPAGGRDHGEGRGFTTSRLSDVVLTLVIVGADYAGPHRRNGCWHRGRRRGMAEQALIANVGVGGVALVIDLAVVWCGRAAATAIVALARLRAGVRGALAYSVLGGVGERDGQGHARAQAAVLPINTLVVVGSEASGRASTWSVFEQRNLCLWWHRTLSCRHCSCQPSL